MRLLKILTITRRDKEYVDKRIKFDVYLLKWGEDVFDRAMRHAESFEK